MEGRHINPELYFKKLHLGESVAEEREHISTCETCRKNVEKLTERKINPDQGVSSYSYVRFLENLIRSGMSLMIPSFRKNLSRSEIQSAEPVEEKFPEPLRVLLPRSLAFFQTSAGKFLIIFALTSLTLLIPMPEGLSSEGQRAIAGFVFTASILALQPVSLPLAALMVPLMLVLLNVASAGEGFETFSRPVVFLILASLFLAEALNKYGLTKRLALYTIVSTKGNIKKLLWGIMGISAFLSMWVENTATAAVLIPVALTISREVKDQKEARKILVLLVLGIAYSASLGGMVTIMGSASNAVASGFLANIRPWTFIDWLQYGLPPFLLIFPLTFFILIRMLPVNIEELNIDQVKKSLEGMGKMKSREVEVLLTMSFAAILWIAGSYIETSLNLPATLMSSAVIAVGAVLYLAGRQLISWDDIKDVSWGIFFIIGAGLSLGEALNRTGVTEWFAVIVSPLVTEPPFWMTLLLLVLISSLLTNVLNNTTIAAVLVPVFISVAASNPGIDAVQLVLPVTLATTFGYSLPSASGRMALIGASGIVSSQEMMRYGLVVTFFSSIVLAAVFYVFTLLNLI
ncbi:MAG: sodium-anion symporter [Bacteroidetes bacterium]|nr:MAG: sodium-anion symporter [Bacteroidota bacterium]REK00944.1 MAG: sodium-anion symporter [Bacteroidota bacterium]REK34547.1 MAG: sodium-anion symporter [Bacteroidota bacterium]REK51806.1 MAG: sodium-anion symporter [Bacteroidota bacterium]